MSWSVSRAVDVLRCWSVQERLLFELALREAGDDLS